MIELTHAIAVYRERLANEGSDYSGKWVLIKPPGDRFEFYPFETEAEATAALNEPSCPEGSFIFQFPYDEVS